MTPTLAPLAEDIYSDLGPLPDDDEAHGWALAHLVNAVLDQFALLDEASRPTDEDPVWAALMDVERTPAQAIAWLGQFVGARLPHRLTVEEQRAYVLAHPEWNRGTVETLLDVVRAFLSGTKAVRLFERDTSPYHFKVRVYASEIGGGTFLQSLQAYPTFADRLAAVPTFTDNVGTNSALIEDAIQAAKPAGLQFELEVATGPTFGEVLDEAPTFADRLAEFPTFADVLDFIP